MGKQDQVLILWTTRRSILPGKIAALADAKNLAETLDGEFLLRRIDETEPHRLPSLAKKVAALFRLSRSCRKISFSRRNRFSSAARSSCRSGGGASISCSRRLSSQRRSVERPTPRSLAISLCVRPLTSTNRTASAANSFPNRRCGLPMKCSSFLQKSSPLSQGKSILDGTVIGRCMRRHRHQEFIRFLNAVERAVPAGKVIHAIVDNYAAHKQPNVLKWLADH